VAHAQLLSNIQSEISKSQNKLNKMKFIISAILFASFSMISAQRGSYAGSSAIISGLRQPFDNSLGQRLGDQQANVPNYLNTNNNYPLNERINNLPPSNQPFWFLNGPAINAHLNIPQPQLNGIAQLNVPGASFQPGTFVGGR
jgi:hypothetical protein